ncbi:MAG: GlsB/YeaQ/YmgE family stress response membrane protein [Phaeodactylibacter sp.]|nr:GlsB/YeaQ/YmgE family stress response membrane protein [Phaeodactylibacter sp.]
MGLIIWLLIGLAAGTIAKMITPQKETGGWVSSMILGMLGSMVGGFIAGLVGLDKLFNTTWLGSLIIAVPGALLVLYIYYRYFAEKWKLPI